MGRLIDADDFYTKVKNETDLCAEMEKDGIEALKKYLDLQPTAYYVDKVVEQLKEASFCDTYVSEETKVVDSEKAIEIVKAGGIDER